MKVLIVGTGQVGYFLCERLSEEGHEVTLIDNDPEHLNRAQERLNVLGILGNGASAEVLEQGGIKNIDIFIAVTDMDEVNILACLLAREYGAKRRIARVRSIEYTSQGAVLSKEKLGIDLLINPRDAVAEEMIQIATHQGAFDVAEFVEGQIQFLGYRIGDKSPLCDLTLKELGEIRGMYRFVVTAIARGERTIIPRGEDTIRTGDSIFIFAHLKDLPAIEYLLQPEPEKACRLRRVFILGGGSIGMQIAQRLEKLRFNVRLIDRDEARCEQLASKLRRSMVIHTDGTDIRTLLDEGLEGADVFIAVTGNDEDNILCSLLAKKHGARRALALINKPEYLNLAPSLGIDACVSPRLAAGAVILKHVRRARVLSLATVEGSNAEVLELLVPEKSGFADVPLKDLHFPRGAIIGAIVRGQEYLIPTGETVLHPLDRVVVFALPEALTKVERFFE